MPPVRAAASSPVETLLALARATALPGVVYDPSAPLSALTNAHRTNTVEEMTRALEAPSTQLEGDVRFQLNPPHALECRHDPGPGRGNLLLADWLDIAKASGRRIKLDIKTHTRMPEIIALVHARNLPPGQLNFNLGDELTEAWAQKLRAGFPGALLSLNCPSTALESILPRPLTEAQLAWCERWARQLAAPVSLVAEVEQLTPALLARLEKTAPVSVYNEASVGHTPDPVARGRTLRAEGCTGIIDLTRTQNALGKAIAYTEFGLSLFEASLYSLRDRAWGKWK